MTGRRLILNDGTSLENCEAGLTPTSLWLYLKGVTMQRAADTFFDSRKTSKIVFQYGEMQDVYEGYTNCSTITEDEAGDVSVCMKKGTDNAS